MKIKNLIAIPIIILLLNSFRGCLPDEIIYHGQYSTEQGYEEQHEPTSDNYREETTLSDENTLTNIDTRSTWSNPQTYTYYYDLLSNEDKQLYTTVYDTLTSFSQSIVVNVSKERLDRCINSIIRDYPEIYYSANYTYSYTGSNDAVVESYIPKYNYSIDVIKNRQNQINSVVAEFMQGAPVNGSEYDKVKYIYEYVTNRVVYDNDVSSTQTLYDALVNTHCVCNGYSMSVKYLCDKLGVRCVYVAGTGYDKTKGWGSHSWNLVNINDKWYSVDATWGDEKIEADGRVYSPVMYDYLCISDDLMLTNHKYDDFITYPSCTSDDLNYYKTNGTYITEASDEAIKHAFENVQKNTGGYIILKCSSEAVLEELKTKLIDERKITRYINENSASSITYGGLNLVLYYW